MKKLIVILVAVLSCNLAQGQDSTKRGFEFGTTVLAYNRPINSFFLPYFFRESSFKLFNGVQLNFNLNRISIRALYNYSNEYIENDGSGCNDCGGGYYFERKKQLKLGVQYSFLKKVKRLYAFGDLTGTTDKELGQMYDGQGMQGGNYAFENKMQGYGWDI